MRNRRKWLIVLATIVFAVVLALAAGAGVSVGQSAYELGGIEISPSAGACIGGSVTLSGSDAPAATEITAIMIDETETLAADLGTVVSDGSGNWTLTTTVPETSIDEMVEEAATTPGTWLVIAGTEDASYLAAEEMEVLDCSASTDIPDTGFPAAAAGLLGTGALASAGLGLGAWRYRRKK